MSKHKRMRSPPLEEAKTQTAVLVIPTYNEAENIGLMMDHLFSKTFKNIKAKKVNKNNWQMKVLVVDGNSPDGTGKVVKQKAKKYKDIYLYTETSKDGIGAAYLKGFKYAINKLKADFVFEFDGDFQHPPESIPIMLKAVEDGCDYVIGSRKIEGGSNPEGWGFKRVFFSEVGGFTARFILFFPFKNFFKVTDPTTGLKVTRVKGFLDKLDMDYHNLYSKSFGYKLELLFNTLKLKPKFKEIPLKFQVRTAGESKIQTQTAKDIFRVAVLLRWHDDFTQKFLKFGTVGFIGYLVNATLLSFISKKWGIEWLSWLLSTEAAIISNFTLNNLWTFKSDEIKGLKIIGKFLQFNFTSMGALLIQTIMGTIGVYLTSPEYRQLLLPFIIVFIVLPYNWFMYNKVIWKKKSGK
ncbi:glycosyltransferase [Patescibacteria group bacterium]|nr:glycosyltransferase [Patescibacteria group bacterium]MCG2702661.1 glycosyltransferase [Candidatus Parcubacteria bacterium]MBU4264870.1 glycosyltransferase [Patescibacteria group bacterium]MBU4389741.1 glycosyltransferase [Patescibacteria group bacterium]MBU4397335.1 glycosyltransferase [Patescibacteria group bacterium]